MLCKNCALGPDSQLPNCARCGQQIHLFGSPVTDEELDSMFSNLIGTTRMEDIPKGRKRSKSGLGLINEEGSACAHDAAHLFAQIKNELQGVFKEDGLTAASRNRLSKILRLMHPLTLEFRKLEALVQIAEAEGRLQQDLSRELHRNTSETLKPGGNNGPHCQP